MIQYEPPRAQLVCSAGRECDISPHRPEPSRRAIFPSRSCLNGHERIDIPALKPSANRTVLTRQFNYFPVQMTTFRTVQNHRVTSGALICDPYLTRTNFGQIRVTITRNSGLRTLSNALQETSPSSESPAICRKLRPLRVALDYLGMLGGVLG